MACYSIRYCSKSCQDKDWPRHKSTCDSIRAAVADAESRTSGLHMGGCSRAEAEKDAKPGDFPPPVGIPSFIAFHKFLMPDGNVRTLRIMGITSQDVPVGYPVRKIDP